MHTSNRRRFLSLLTAGLTTPYLLTFASEKVRAAGLDGVEFSNTNVNFDTASLSTDSSSVFDVSISSGDPTASGVILWTRIAPSAWRSNEPLYFQVSNNADFSSLVLQGVIAANAISSDRDNTVKIDLNGTLETNTRYFYRFIYNNTASKTGRCRTSPQAGTQSLKLALVVCQDYTNGYYGTFDHIAKDDSIDFVIHLGDLIYESAADPRFQSLSFADRIIELPSSGSVAMDLQDYRTLYRIYRSDPFFQKALENHTWIITRDDHETANDCYWDYARNTLGAPDHPYTTDAKYGNNPLLLNQLMLDSQRAWLEYIPARVQVNESSTDPHQFLKHYRRFDLGGFVDLFMLDTRTYRTHHPCGEATVGGRYLPLQCKPDVLNASGQFLMGTEQREWLINGLSSSSARWKLVGNQTYMGKLGFKLSKYSDTPVDVDAWDGYSYERNILSQELKSNDVNNLVVITGDLHTYIASTLKIDYMNRNPADTANLLGVEFMTPSVTSAGLLDMFSTGKASQQPLKPVEKLALIEFMNVVVRSANPHIRYFNTIDHGYSTLEFKPTYCEWSAYTVDKNVNNSLGGKKLARRYRKYEDNPNIVPV